MSQEINPEKLEQYHKDRDRILKKETDLDAELMFLKAQRKENKETVAKYERRHRNHIIRFFVVLVLEAIALGYIAWRVTP